MVGTYINIYKLHCPRAVSKTSILRGDLIHLRELRSTWSCPAPKIRFQLRSCEWFPKTTVAVAGVTSGHIISQHPPYGLSNKFEVPKVHIWLWDCSYWTPQKRTIGIPQRKSTCVTHPVIPLIRQNAQPVQPTLGATSQTNYSTYLTSY
jgi:hypothetical protein